MSSDKYAGSLQPAYIKGINCIHYGNKQYWFGVFGVTIKAGLKGLAQLVNYHYKINFGTLTNRRVPC